MPWSERLGLLVPAVLFLLSSCGGGGTGSTIPTNPPPPVQVTNAFFGMNMTSAVLTSQPWPGVPIGSIRLWDTMTNWYQLNPAPGAYDWSMLDAWISSGQSHGITDLMYTFGKTPAWASSQPNDTSCAADWPPGSCDPPNNLSADGSGTDEEWKEFVTALAQHVAGKIKYWEVWNEPANPAHWTGTVAQLARMARDARQAILSADPNAKLLAPPADNPWLTAYLAAGGVDSADIFTIHGYVRSSCGTPPQATDLVPAVEDIRNTMAANNAANKQLWDTEASWGNQNVNCFTDPDQQTAFLGQFYLVHLSEHVDRFYWYQWNNQAIGTLWNSSSRTLTAPGTAYQTIVAWLSKTTMSTRCSVVGTQWMCPLSGNNGYKAEVLWDTSLSCNGGNCPTVQLAVSNDFTKYEDLMGNVFSIQANTVPVGAKPILIESQ